MRAFIGALLLLVACQPPSPPVPPPNPPDASDAASPALGDALPPTTPCEAACVNLRVLGCKEAIPGDCIRVLAHIESAHLVRTTSGAPLTCTGIAGAKSPADARAQGVACAP